MIEYVGLWILSAMMVNMWALTCVLQSGVSVIQKVIWAAILLVPVLGFVGWFLLGPRMRSVG